MIHVRAVSPADLTGELVEALQQDVGVLNLVRLGSSLSRPEGDAVQFDVVNGRADAVLRSLRDLGIAERGSIVVENVDTVISETANAVERTQSRYDDFAPIWDEVESKIRADGVYPPSWFALMTIAGVIGAVGLLTNSQILIVGAMVVGPEYGAITSAAFGITTSDRHRVWLALRAMLVGFSLAVLVALLFALAIRGAGKTPTAFSAGFRPVTELISSPNIFSFTVAFLAAIVGVVSLTTARAGTLIGVFISVTTIPAAADIGVATAYASWSEAIGSLEQLVLNVVVLVSVGAAALVGQRWVWERAGRRLVH